MIVLDTHVWVHWVGDDRSLSDRHRALISESESGEIGISIMSCWEVAVLVSVGRLRLTLPPLDWIEQALKYPGARLINLTPAIVVDSTQLPGEFHRDPADRLLVATARALKCPLLTRDERILAYAHVERI